MKVTKKMMKLISDIEYEIGGSCYNANSYNGWTDEYGCSFRYPIVYETKIEEKVIPLKTRLRISDNSDITPENLRTVCYKFGSNELCIGAAVVDVLDLLEKRYGLDFAKMESEYIKKQKE